MLMEGAKMLFITFLLLLGVGLLIFFGFWHIRKIEDMLHRSSALLERCEYIDRNYKEIIGGVDKERERLANLREGQIRQQEEAFKRIKEQQSELTKIWESLRK